jgi:hypothetical protein
MSATAGLSPLKVQAQHLGHHFLFTPASASSPGPAILSGAGELRLRTEINQQDAYLTGSVAGMVTDLENFSTISGHGIIGRGNSHATFGYLALHNHGVVTANVDGRLLVIDPGTTNLLNAPTNDGTFQAVGSAG